MVFVGRTWESGGRRRSRPDLTAADGAEIAARPLRAFISRVGLFFGQFARAAVANAEDFFVVHGFDPSAGGLGKAAAVL
jgi:hypothetical protein